MQTNYSHCNPCKLVKILSTNTFSMKSFIAMLIGHQTNKYEELLSGRPH